MSIISIDATNGTMSQPIISSTRIANIFYQSDCLIPGTQEAVHFGETVSFQAISYESYDMIHIFFEDFSVRTSLVNLVIFFTIDESKLFSDNKKNTKTCLDGNLHTEIRFDVVLV